MTSITKEAAIEILKPYIQTITQLVHRAWSDWRATGNPQWHSRGMANFVWEQFIVRAREVCKLGHGIHLIQHGETCLFVVDQKLVFKFKKAGSTLKTSNLPTTSAIAFHDPEAQLPLPEFAGTLPRVEVVYQLNRLRTAITDIVIVARNKTDVVWNHSILNHQDDLGALIIQPVTPPDNDPLAKKRRVRVAKEVLVPLKNTG